MNWNLKFLSIFLLPATLMLYMRRRRGRLNQLCETLDENGLSKPGDVTGSPSCLIVGSDIIEFVGGRAPNWLLVLQNFA